MRDFLIALVLMAVVFCGGYHFGRTRVNNEPEPQIDTLYRVDTLTVEKPVEIARGVVEKIYVPVTDTVTIHDTLFVLLDREQKVYGDSVYTAWVSGYQPALDSIQFILKERTYIINRTKTIRPRWSAGPQVGVGLSTEGFVPYVGIGVTYNLFSW